MLLVGNGENGMTFYTLANPATPAVLTSARTLPARDFIWTDNELFVMGSLDVRVYAMDNPLQPRLLGTID